MYQLLLDREVEGEIVTFLIDESNYDIIYYPNEWSWLVIHEPNNNWVCDSEKKYYVKKV